jgi:hypothetical protein
MRSKKKKLSAVKPQRVVGNPEDKLISTIPTTSQAVQTNPAPGPTSDAVKAAVADLMKQTFGTKDEELQYRFVMQAGTIFPDFTGRELKSFDLVAASLRGIGPRDSLEGMLGVQMVATHVLAMEFMRRAAFNAQTDLGVEVCINRATKLLRTFTSLTETLGRYRGKGEQKMTVEHVHVYQGGQAIVGQVSQNNNQVNQEKTSGKDDKLE